LSKNIGFKSSGTADYGGRILNLPFFMADIHIIFGRRAQVGLLKKCSAGQPPGFYICYCFALNIGNIEIVVKILNIMPFN
jgi:hypothetical protein